MSGASATRPMTRRSISSTWTARVGAIAAVVVLVVGCASPTPSPSGSPSASFDPGASGAPQATASPGVTPLPVESPSPTPTPEPGTWSDVGAQPLAQVATLAATQTSAAGVLPGTAFTLTALDGSPAVTLARHVVAEPALAFTTSGSGATATLKPTTALEAGGLYRFRLLADDGTVRAAWAIAAVGPLHVSHTIPGDTSTDVPTNAGIEITFDQVGVAITDLSSHIIVQPGITGHIEGTGRSLAFVPDAPLAPATVYTVTVKAGLPLAGTGMTLEQPYTFAFETAGGATINRFLRIYHRLVQVSPADNPDILVQIERDEEYDDDGNLVNEAAKAPKALDVAVYQLPDMTTAIAHWRALHTAPEWAMHGGSPVDTTGLPRVFNGSVPIQPVYDWDGYEFRMRLPQHLDAGYYLVEVQLDGQRRHMVLEVSRLAAFTLVTETKTVVWVNDAVTGAAVSGATARVDSVLIGTTGSQGLVTGTTPASALVVSDLPDGKGAQGPDTAVLVVQSGGRSVFTPIDNGLCGACSGAISDPWWHIFSLNRSQYRSTDTILAWGMLRDRASGAVPATVTVRLRAWDGGEGVSTDLATYKPAPDAAGVFQVAIPIRDLPVGDYDVVLEAGGSEVSAQSIVVAPITKPAWSITMTTAKHAVIAGARLLITVSARFFEGTPVAGTAMDVAVSSDDQGTAHGRVTTGADGTDSIRLRIPWDTNYNNEAWYTTGISATPVNPEEGLINGSTEIAVFKASVIAKTTSTSTAGGVTLTGTAHDVALARFETSGLPIWEIDPYGRTRAGVPVHVAITEHWWTTVRTGTRYDFITKRTVPTYDTTEHERTLPDHELISGAGGRFSVALPALAAGHYYQVTLKLTDSAGRVSTTEDTIGSEEPDTLVDRYTNLQLLADEGATFSIGERVTAVLGGGMVQQADRRVLWLEASRGLVSATVARSTRHTSALTADTIPYLRLTAVRWTGHAYEMPASTEIPFRIDDRGLTVTATPDKASYRPGGSATVNVRITDADGNPVSASVYLRVIDEKLFAMGLAEAGYALGDLYTDPGSGMVAMAWTHFDPTMDDGGKGDTTGGGGDGRDDFRDWLDAVLFTTGADGRGSRTFELSDDLTSWRVLVSAVSTNFEAGDGQVLLPVSLPFFAEATVAAEYLVTDRPVIAVRGFGGGLTASSTVRFTISSDTLPMAPVTLSAHAYAPAEVALPALTEGRHRITISATTGSGTSARTDTLVRTFTVIRSRALQAVTTSTTLTGPVSVPSGAGLTTLVLADAGRGRVLPVLQELRGEEPIRVDRMLAAALADRTLAARFGLPATGSGSGPVSAYEGDYGSLAVVPWGDPELELTVLAILADDPRVQVDSTWLDEYEATTREQRFWVLAGRAALGQSVIGDLRLAADLANLTPGEEVALALGALAAGDDELATRLERLVLAEHGQRQVSFVRILDVDGTPSPLLTARLAIVAASLGDPVAMDMDAWLVRHLPTTTLVDLERALAAAGWASRLPAADAAATLTVDGTPQTLSIAGSQAVVVRLTRAQAASATLAPASGTVTASFTIDGPLDPASISTPAGVTVQRIVQPSGTIDATDLVTVTIRVALPSSLGDLDSCWAVTELVPSGLAPIWNDGSMDEGDEDTGAFVIRPWRMAGQVVSFCVTPDPQRLYQTLRYAARVVTPGSYTWEPAVLQSTQDPSQGALTESGRLVIRGLTN